MIRLLKRCATTALKAPVAAAADLATLGKFGEGSYLGDLAREHHARAEVDEMLDLLDELRDATGGDR